MVFSGSLAVPLALSLPVAPFTKQAAPQLGAAEAGAAAIASAAPASAIATPKLENARNFNLTSTPRMAPPTPIGTRA
jgi:hypothetical protein